MTTLSVAIVTYETPVATLTRALASLAHAIEGARAAGMLGGVQLFVIDNSPAAAHARIVEALRCFPDSAGSVELLHGHGNVGYARGNNLVLDLLRSELHLVMNPDVVLAPDAIVAALRALQAHPETGLLAPSVFDDHGERQYLCRRYPSAWVLFLRGMAPRWLRERFRATLDRYEMRDVMGDRFMAPVPLASGCFMLLRTALFRGLGGFDPRFFMYFEDYDLSVRLGRESTIGFAPEVGITHGGGDASRKGWRHVAWFTASAVRFFNAHGWRIR